MCVLPTPVGPQNSITAGGRAGSFKPAFTVITTFVAASHASGWSITRARNQFKTSSHASVISSRKEQLRQSSLFAELIDYRAGRDLLDPQPHA